MFTVEITKSPELHVHHVEITRVHVSYQIVSLMFDYVHSVEITKSPGTLSDDIKVLIMAPTTC